MKSWRSSGSFSAVAVPLHQLGQLEQPRAEFVGDDLRLMDAAVREPRGGLLHFGEEIVGSKAAIDHLLFGFAQLVMHQQAAVGAIVVELVEQVIDLRRRDAQSQVVAGDVLQRMGLVEDHHFVVGQDARPLPPQGQVAEEQRVVDDQDLRVLGPPPGLVVEAVAVAGALPAQAVAMIAFDFVPDMRPAGEREDRPASRRASSPTSCGFAATARTLPRSRNRLSARASALRIRRRLR